MAREGRFSDYYAQQVLDDLSNQAQYLGLSVSDPFSVTDPLTVEPTPTGYVRAPVNWLRVGRVLRNVQAVSWTGLAPATRIPFIVAWDAPMNGHALASIPIDVVELPNGGGFAVGVQQLFLGLDL